MKKATIWIAGALGSGVMAFAAAFTVGLWARGMYEAFKIGWRAFGLM